MIRSRPRTTAAALMLVWMMMLPGCGPKPRAPVLGDDPVYQNDQEGFRFLVPQGWKVTSRADTPPGKLKKEMILANYRKQTGKGASFLVTVTDLPTSTDLAEHLAGPSYGVAKWNASGPPVKLKAGGVDGVRYTFKARAGKEERAKEVFSVRRDERVIVFMTLYSASDTEARDEVRRVVDSVVWKK